MDWIMVEKHAVFSPYLTYNQSSLVDEEKTRTLMFHSFAPSTLWQIHTGGLFAKIRSLSHTEPQRSAGLLHLPSAGLSHVVSSEQVAVIS